MPSCRRHGALLYAFLKVVASGKHPRKTERGEWVSSSIIEELVVEEVNV
jgi:hypothetical protein